MTDPDPVRGLVPALLKQWRSQRGLSQLDLALAADVSARHISFLETGRSRPSAAMVRRLGATLGVSLRQVNTMMVAAGHDAVIDEDEGSIPEPVVSALDVMSEHHEPFPLFVLDRAYSVLDANAGAVAILGAILGRPRSDKSESRRSLAGSGLNLARLTFDPLGAQPYIANFEDVGRELLWRIHREVLDHPDDPVRRNLLDDLLAQPTVPERWRDVDLAATSEPALVVHLRRDELELRFVTTVTVFQAPQNLAVEELRIEHWFPADDATRRCCRELESRDFH